MTTPQEKENMAIDLIIASLEAMGSNDLVSNKKFKVAIERMPVRDQQIFLTNLKKILASRTFYQNRVTTKQYEKFIKMVDGILNASYKGLKGD